MPLDSVCEPVAAFAKELTAAALEGLVGAPISDCPFTMITCNCRPGTCFVPVREHSSLLEGS